jgi:hypothetical protein
VLVNEGHSKSHVDGQGQGFEDVGHKVGGADEIDVVTTLLLQHEHDKGQMLEGNPLSLTQSADGVVLAENTAQVAVGHEDGAGAALPHQRLLLPEVCAVGGDLGHARCPAKARFPQGAVNGALARAQGAGIQKIPGLLDFPGQEAPFMGRHVGGLE